MGTRADFWVGREDASGWLGSIGWDGYPDGIVPMTEGMVPMWTGGPTRNKNGAWPEGGHLLDSTTEEDFRARVERFFLHRLDVTLPARGWPWPWEDSCTTDYAYVFEAGSVRVYCFGSPVKDWRNPEDEEFDAPKARFPDMTAVTRVTYGPGSGLIVVGARGPEE